MKNYIDFQIADIKRLLAKNDFTDFFGLGEDATRLEYEAQLAELETCKLSEAWLKKGE